MSMLPEPFRTYVRLGLRIFPAIGKRPWAAGWQKEATSDPAKIARWLQQYPQGNWGLATGNNIAVLDIDPRHGGDKSLKQLRLLYGDTLKTVMSHTGGGGWHLLFRTQERIRNAVNLLDGVDVRGDGGLIILPPSVHPESGKQYEWVAGYSPDERDFAPLPERIAVALRAPIKVSSSSGAQWAKIPTEVAARLTEVCPWLADAVGQGADDVNYQQWLAIASWVHSMTEDQGLFHDWSRGYSNYDPDATALKWTQTATLAPIGCAQVEGQSCTLCHHKERGSNPVTTLRRMYASELGELGYFGAPDPRDDLIQLAAQGRTEQTEFLLNNALAQGFDLSETLEQLEKMGYSDFAKWVTSIVVLHQKVKTAMQKVASKKYKF